MNEDTHLLLDFYLKHRVKGIRINVFILILYKIKLWFQLCKLTVNERRLFDSRSQNNLDLYPVYCNYD